MTIIKLPCGRVLEGYNQEFESEIPQPGVKCPYAFMGQAGDVVTIAINRIDEGLDPFLELIAPGGQVEATDDDSGGGRNSLITAHTLRQSGPYNIIARDYANQGKGRFTLGLWASGSPAAVNPPSIPQTVVCGGSIATDGTPVNGYLPLGATCDYRFAASAGDSITIALDRLDGDLDPFVELIGPGGGVLASDDDSGGDRNSQISCFTIPVDGAWRGGVFVPRSRQRPVHGDGHERRLWRGQRMRRSPELWR